MIRVRDLPEQADGFYLYCSRCLGEFSAQRGDYFTRSPDHIMVCHRRLLRLARTVTHRAVYPTWKSGRLPE